jgi:hypothetical protein
MRVLAGEHFVESNSPPQNAVEDIGSNSSSSEAGNFRLWGSARTRHTRIVAAKLCPRRELSPKMSETHSFSSRVRSLAFRHRVQLPLQLVQMNEAAANVQPNPLSQ